MRRISADLLPWLPSVALEKKSKIWNFKDNEQTLIKKIVICISRNSGNKKCFAAFLKQWKLILDEIWSSQIKRLKTSSCCSYDMVCLFNLWVADPPLISRNTTIYIFTALKKLMVALEITS